MKLLIALGKLVVLAGWAWGILSFITPESVPQAGIGQTLFLGLLAVHAAEAYIFAKRLASEAGGSLGSHIGKLLVFGYFHVLGVRYA